MLYEKKIIFYLNDYGEATTVIWWPDARDKEEDEDGDDEEDDDDDDNNEENRAPFLKNATKKNIDIQTSQNI